MTKAPALAESLGRELAQEPAVAAAYLHGSFARGHATPLSDVDIAVLPRAGIDAIERAHLHRRLLLRLGRLVPNRVMDVRFLDELPIAIAGRALAQGNRLVDNDPPRRVHAEVAIRMRYHDYLPYERVAASEGIAGLRRRLAHG